MKSKSSNNEWDINRCSKPFSSTKDATEYMETRKFAGTVLELEDGSIQAVCPAYPEGFYPGAKVLAQVDAENCCDISK